MKKNDFTENCNLVSFNLQFKIDDISNMDFIITHKKFESILLNEKFWVNLKDDNYLNNWRFYEYSKEDNLVKLFFTKFFKDFIYHKIDENNEKKNLLKNIQVTMYKEKEGSLIIVLGIIVTTLITYSSVRQAIDTIINDFVILLTPIIQPDLRISGEITKEDNIMNDGVLTCRPRKSNKANPESLEDIYNEIIELKNIIIEYDKYIKIKDNDSNNQRINVGKKCIWLNVVNSIAIIVAIIITAFILCCNKPNETKIEDLVKKEIEEYVNRKKIDAVYKCINNKNINVDILE